MPRFLLQEISFAGAPENLVGQLGNAAGIVLLRSAGFQRDQARYSIVTARPFLTFRSFGSMCELNSDAGLQIQFGDPWRLLDSLMARYELLEQLDLPFPLGGCFGYWGYDLKNFVEPKLSRRALNDLELPDCHVGFYDSLVVFDHWLNKTWIVSTGLTSDGSRSDLRASQQSRFWQHQLASVSCDGPRSNLSLKPGPEWPGPRVFPHERHFRGSEDFPASRLNYPWSKPESRNYETISSCLTRQEFLERVQRAQSYISAGDIYQVNLSHRLSARLSASAWDFFLKLSSVSPAPFSAFLDCGEFQVVSSSPELFLRLSGSHIQTRPIKGTRPRSADPIRDAQLSYELQTSPKETAELLMITDLLRNDLGKVCEFGSVQVPELMRLERYSQVQHLVSTIEGRLRGDVTHFAALASTFPGGSITGAPKFRAMEIIDELEPVSRGAYTGALGYLGFNRESQLSILIRTAICKDQDAFFHAGAGIVADSLPAAEYDETLAKAGGFFAALGLAPEAASPIGYSHTSK